MSDIGGARPRTKKNLAEHIADLFRLLGSNHDGEVLNAVAAMKRVFERERLSFADIATVITNHRAEIEEGIEELKYSETDFDMMHARAVERGMEKGRKEEAAKWEAPPEFFDAFGEPRWLEIATFCQRNSDRLRNQWEIEFANSVPEKIVRYGAPTEKMEPHLLGIFIKLGGRYDAQALHVYRQHRRSA
jgi:hypothetical protein